MSWTCDFKSKTEIEGGRVVHFLLWSHCTKRIGGGRNWMHAVVRRCHNFFPMLQDLYLHHTEVFMLVCSIIQNLFSIIDCYIPALLGSSGSRYWGHN